jgi:hypothetical protein
VQRLDLGGCDAGARGPWVDPPSDGARHAALISGTLTVLDGNCLDLSFDGHDEALAFPHGTTAATEGTGIVTAEGVTILVGQDLEAGGGIRGIEPAANWVLERWLGAPSGFPQADSAAGIHDVELAPVP